MRLSLWQHSRRYSLCMKLLMLRKRVAARAGVAAAEAEAEASADERRRYGIIIYIVRQWRGGGVYVGSSGLISIPARAFGNSLKNIPIIIPAVYRKALCPPPPTFHLAPRRKYLNAYIIHELRVLALCTSILYAARSN